MIIHHNPDDYEVHIENRICEFHKKNPGVNYAGCMCMASYLLRRRSKD